MRILRNSFRFFLVSALFAFASGVATAGERCDIVYTNDLDETILNVRVRYSTPYDEPRFDSSRIDLPAGGESRIGIQGTTQPEMMIVDLATKSYVFDDLSGLNPANFMHIAIDRKGDKPLIRRIDAEGEAEGIEREYLTVANRPNAVDKDFVMDVATYDELMKLIRGQIGGAVESQGGLESLSLEAGPLWNHQHALDRCPEVAREWSGENGREARWTGHWRTTVPGEMSECDCVTGTADEKETVFVEEEWRDATTYFPVFWMEWFGVGHVTKVGESGEGLPIAMRFRLPGEGATTMLGELLEDIRVDGYRPVLFAIEAVDLDEDGDVRELMDEEVNFLEKDDNKWDAHDRIMEFLTAGYAGTALKASLAWIEDDAFETAKAGGEVPATRGILCLFTRDTFGAVFVPDGSAFLQ